jgi:hypothetical protein
MKNYWEDLKAILTVAAGILAIIYSIYWAWDRDLLWWLMVLAS